MDGNLMDKYELLEKKLETALDIIMEHFHENEERMEEIEAKLEELESGFLQNVNK